MGRLLDGPGVAGEDHVAELVKAVLGADLFDLLLDLAVIDGRVDITDDTDSERQVVAVHHCELLVQEVAGAVGVVDEDVIEGIAVLSDGDSLEQEAVADESALEVFAEEHFLAVAQVDGALGTVFLVGDEVVDAVIENDAVLKHFDDRRTVVACGLDHDFTRGLELDVDGAGKEVAACAKDELGRDEGVFGRTVRRRFRDKAAVARGGVLSLCQTVNLVVEQQDVDVDIAADGVDEMVAADGKAVAVARDLPHGHVGAGHLEACRDGGGASVDGVEAIGVHVVGQTRAATDA